MNLWTKFSQKKSIPLAWSYAQIITLLIFIIAGLSVIALNTSSILPRNVSPVPGTRILLEPKITATPISTQMSNSFAIIANPEVVPTLIPDPNVPADNIPQTNGSSVSEDVPIEEESSKAVVAMDAPILLSRVGQMATEGLRLHRYGDYDEAQARLGSVIATTTEDHRALLDAHFLLARTYLANDNYQSALSTLDKLYDILDVTKVQAPTTASELGLMSEFLRGEIHTKLGQQGLAIAAYGRFLEQYPWSCLSKDRTSVSGIGRQHTCRQRLSRGC